MSADFGNIGFGWIALFTILIVATLATYHGSQKLGAQAVHQA